MLKKLKQAAQTLIYLQEHGLSSYDALKEKTAAACERGTFAPEQQLRIYDTDGQFTGIYAWKQEEKRLKPVKMFLGKEQ